MGGLSCLFDKLVQAEERSKRNAAYAYMLMGHLLMVCMWSLFKQAMNLGVDYNQVLYIRGAIVFAFNSYVIASLKHPVYPESVAAQRTLLVKSIIQLMAPLLQFYGISQLHISDATVLSLTGPIWVQLSSWLIYGEKLEGKNYLLTLLSFVGIIFVTRPEFIFGSNSVSDDSEGKNRFLGCLLMLAGSMSLAVSQSLMKGLQGKTSNFVTMHYFYLTNLLITPLCLMNNETNDVRLFTEQYFILLLGIITVIAYAGQLMLSRGLMLESPARLSQLAYTRIIYAFLIDLLIFTVKMNVLSLIGFAFILVSSYKIVKQK